MHVFLPRFSSGTSDSLAGARVLDVSLPDISTVMPPELSSGAVWKDADVVVVEIADSETVEGWSCSGGI
jgi:hypothetical protein